VLVAAFPAAMRYAGPREALFHAIARKNYGITHIIVGRDHAGVGGYYPPFAAQQMFDTFGPDQIGVSPLRLDVTFYCRACDGMASVRTCPHDPSMRVELSGSRVRALLASGGDLPREFSRPEVAAILREHYQKVASEEPTASGFVASDVVKTVAKPGGAPAQAKGAIVWFTGLSGAGKSTLAGRVRERLIASGRSVEVLDGDEIRTHLSKGLGFSKADRDTNINRIAFVARLVAKQGSVAITAAISPYAGARDDARRQAQEAGVDFVEVFADASIDALTARDVEGLYKKALAGEIANFTGVSDPYERPVQPDLVVYTDKESVDESAARVLALLESRGIIRSTAR
jgi:sulfate adenylyltransferase